MACPKCNGKLKIKSAKKPGGIRVYRCKGCHRQFVVDRDKGGLKELVNGRGIN